MTTDNRSTDPTVGQALQQARQLLEDNPEIDSRFEVSLLLAHVLEKNLTWLIAWPEKTISAKQYEHFLKLVQRRHQGEPISHITGLKEFWGLPLQITIDTLIPRPETELIVETALQLLDPVVQLQALDLGTGSGALAAALTSERPGWHFLATDLSAKALETAGNNFARLGLSIATRQSNWFANIQPQLFDLIISNPPYIEENDPHLVRGDLRFEPPTALVSGRSGLDDLQQIIATAPAYLQPNGLLIVEHGYNQGEKVRELFTTNRFSKVETRRDLAGNERITLGHQAT